MSINLHLKATRQVFTKSGREFQQTEEFNLWQTPDNVTWDILSKGSFNDKLKAYEKWCLTLEEEPFKSFYPVPVSYNRPVPKPGDDFYYLGEEGLNLEPAGVVISAIYNGDKKFDEIIKDENDSFLILYPNPEEISLFLEIRSFTHCDELKMKLNKYREEEWEFEFYAL
jgi:hypothetical protein